MDWWLRGYGIQWLWVKGLCFVIIGLPILLSPIFGVPLSIYIATFPLGPLAHMKLGPKAPSHSLMLGLYIIVNHACTSKLYPSMQPLCPLTHYFTFPKAQIKYLDVSWMTCHIP